VGDQLLAVMALDDGPELVRANLKPRSLDFFRDDVLASEFEAWAYVFVSGSLGSYNYIGNDKNYRKRDGFVQSVSYYHV
jgi:hypothetical protein